MTPAVLRTLRAADPDTWAPLLSRTIQENAIRNVAEFLANVLHESGRLHTLRESMNYNVAGLLRTFPTHFTQAQANQYGRIDGMHSRAADQWWIAEFAYGGRMGNRPAGHGDGFNFRGVGPLQITGRDNLMAFANNIGWTAPLEALAEYLATPAGGAAAAGQFWRVRGCDSLPTTAAIRARINGGSNGLAEVTALRAEVSRAMGVVIPARLTVSPELSADDLNARSLQQALQQAQQVRKYP